MSTELRLSELIGEGEGTRDLFFFRRDRPRIPRLKELCARKAALFLCERDLVTVATLACLLAVELCAHFLRGRHLLEYLEVRGGLFQTLEDTVSDEAKEELLLATLRESETSLGSDRSKLELKRQLNECWLRTLTLFRQEEPRSCVRDALRIVDLGLTCSAKPSNFGLQDPVQIAFVDSRQRKRWKYVSLDLPQTAHPCLAQRLRKLRISNYEGRPEIREDLLKNAEESREQRLDICLAADSCLKASNLKAHNLVLVYAITALSRFQFLDLRLTGASPEEARVANFLEARAVLSLFEQLAASLGALQADPQLTASCLLRMKDFACRTGLSELPSFRLRFKLGVQRFLGQLGLWTEEREAFEVLMEDLLPLRKSTFLQASILCHLTAREDAMGEKLLLCNLELSLHDNCYKSPPCVPISRALEREIVNLAALHERMILFFRSFDFGDTWFEKHLAYLHIASGYLHELLPIRSKRFHESQRREAVRVCIKSYWIEHLSPFLDAVWFHVQENADISIAGVKNFTKPTCNKISDKEYAPDVMANGTHADLLFNGLFLFDLNWYFFTSSLEMADKDPVLHLCEAFRDALLNLAGPRHPRLALAELCLKVVQFHRQDWPTRVAAAHAKLSSLRRIFNDCHLCVPGEAALSFSSSSGDEEELTEEQRLDLENKWTEANQKMDFLRVELYPEREFVCPHSELSNRVELSAPAAKEDLSVPEELRNSLLFQNLRDDKFKRSGTTCRSFLRTNITSRLRSCSNLDFCLEIVDDSILSLAVLEGFRSLALTNPRDKIFY